MKAPVQSQRVTIWLCLALAAATIALYLPALHHDFLLYDDQQYVTENPHVRLGLSWQGVGWAFGYHASNWHPLAWLSHMLDCEIYGLKAGGHHLTNVLLHTASAVVLFLLLNRMTGARWRSFFVAGLVRVASAARRVGGVGGGAEGCVERIFRVIGAVSV